ncbi:MAG: hypothetical protein IPF93_14845 [Saprospiraceae bacterium]|nr:hypothetical protein [Saprospiraceae bacterium]
MPFQLLLESAEDVDRIVIREDIKDGAKHLSRAEKAIGVVRYGLLLDAGYVFYYAINPYNDQ